MLRQYAPQRFRWQNIGGKEHPVGTVPVGTIVRFPHKPRDPFIVEAWHTREIGAGRLEQGKWRPVYCPLGGHLATLRSLRTGYRARFADWFILSALGDEW